MRFLRRVRVSVLVLLLLSCATAEMLPPVSLDLFVPAPPSDPWRYKIRDWQTRHQSDPAVADRGVSPAESPLAREYAQFARKLRHRIVEETVRWVQERSREVYRADGETDHWATLDEVIRTGGDDCDGLDLLTFVLLRRFGFREDEIYRSIVVERASGQHHMVTLWFEGGSRADPYLLDPTGVVSRKVVRLSKIRGWAPIQLFDEHAHFRVEPFQVTRSVSHR